MTNIRLCLQTPVNITDKVNMIIPPIIYSKSIYLISERKLYNVLDRINLSQDYNKAVRAGDYSYLPKWLSSKELMNEGFLENVSNYWLNDIDIKKINNYRFFQKDLNNNPLISSHYIKDSLRKAAIYNHISKQRDKFNNFVSKEIDFIEHELSRAEDNIKYEDRRNVFKKGLFENILADFLSNTDPELSHFLQDIEEIDVINRTHLNISDLALYRTASVHYYSSYKPNLTNSAQEECLKRDTTAEMEIILKNFLSGNCSNISYLSDLFQQAENLAQDKICFEKRYLEKTLPAKAECLDAINSINTINSSKKLVALNYSQNEFSSGGPALLDNVDYQKLKEFSLIDYYNAIKDSNFLLLSNDQLNKLITVLNLEEYNINRINTLILGKMNSLEADIVRVTLRKGNIPYSPIGFTKVSV